MRRRDFIAASAGALAVWPISSFAQQSGSPVIGFLSAASSEAFADRVKAFREGLSEAGFEEGRNVAIEFRWANFDASRLPALTSELVVRKVNLIVTFGGTSPALAAKAATPDIPIVFGAVSEDPVRAGLVSSLARPGGNVTGIVSLGAEIGPKRMELLREMLPAAKTFAVLVNQTSVANIDAISKSYQDLAHALGLRVQVLNVTTERDLIGAFTEMARLGADGLVVAPDPYFNSVRSQIAALCREHNLPTVFQFREFVAGGGLVAYGASLPEGWRLVGGYAGRILKGDKAGDLPVQQATKLELIVNLRAAKALGLSTPQTLLARADEVIE
jgi:putative ABC transport system substrate-binding protein